MGQQQGSRITSWLGPWPPCGLWVGALSFQPGGSCGTAQKHNVAALVLNKSMQISNEQKFGVEINK